MKLDTETIVKMIERKGVSWVGAMAVGMAWCAMDDDICNLVRRYIGLAAGGGGGAMVVSVLISLMNDGKKGAVIAELKEEAANNLYRAPDGMMLVSVEAKQGEVVQK